MNITITSIIVFLSIWFERIFLLTQTLTQEKTFGEINDMSAVPFEENDEPHFASLNTTFGLNDVKLSSVFVPVGEYSRIIMGFVEGWVVAFIILITVVLILLKNRK